MKKPIVLAISNSTLAMVPNFASGHALEIASCETMAASRPNAQKPRGQMCQLAAAANTSMAPTNQTMPMAFEIGL